MSLDIALVGLSSQLVGALTERLGHPFSTAVAVTAKDVRHPAMIPVSIAWYRWIILCKRPLPNRIVSTVATTRNTSTRLKVQSQKKTHIVETTNVVTELGTIITLSKNMLISAIGEPKGGVGLQFNKLEMTAADKQTNGTHCFILPTTEMATISVAG